jgi:predicted phosphodiesterase
LSDVRSAKEIIELLLAFAENNPTIKRDDFRKIVPESEYLKHFADFDDLKVKAGLAPTRTAKKEFRAFKLHKSVESLKDYNKEKFGWKEIWKRPSNRRFQFILCGSDMHDLYCDPFYRRMFIEAAKKYQPQIIVLNGDILDMPEFSKYNKRVSDLKPRERLLWLSHFLSDLRNASPDSEINYVEGNHEYRLIHHILEKTPSMEELIDICGLNIRNLLQLDNFEVNYYSRADIGTFTESDIRNELKKNYYMFRDLVVFYHYPEGRTKFGMPGVSGHHHKYQVWPMRNITYGTYNWVQMGAGSIRHAEYLDHAEAWQNGFTMVCADTQNKQNLNINYIDCTNETCVFDSTLYHRTESEKLLMPRF